AGIAGDRIPGTDDVRVAPLDQETVLTVRDRGASPWIDADQVPLDDVPDAEALGAAGEDPPHDMDAVRTISRDHILGARRRPSPRAVPPPPGGGDSVRKVGERDAVAERVEGKTDVIPRDEVAGRIDGGEVRVVRRGRVVVSDRVRPDEFWGAGGSPADEVAR